MIEKVEVNGFLTGKNSKNDTLNRFRVGGTDLGMPLYNSVTNEMFLAFGDTFFAPLDCKSHKSDAILSMPVKSLKKSTTK